MVTTIIWRGNFRHRVDPARPPKDVRELDSFLYFNGAPKNILRGQGGWYQLSKDGTMRFVARALYLLSLEEWLKEALTT